MANTYAQALAKSTNQVMSPVGLTDQTTRAAELIRAKSGQAQPGTDIVKSNQAEQTQVANARQEQQQVVQPTLQAQVAGATQQMQGIEQQQVNQLADLSQSRQYVDQQATAKLNGILDTLRTQKYQLDLDTKQSMMEQAGFMLAMRDREYVDKLEQVGKLRNLQDKINYSNEMQDVVFGSSIELIKVKLGQADVLDASRRDYNQALAKLSIDDAIQIADMESQHGQTMFDIAREKAKYGYSTEAALNRIAGQGQAVSGLVSGGIGAYGTYQSAQDRKEASARQAEIDQADREYKKSMLEVLSKSKEE